MIIVKNSDILKEEDKESIYQTPKNYSTKRRIKKISYQATTKKCFNNYDDSAMQMGLESTNYTRDGSHCLKSKFIRKTE